MSLKPIKLMIRINYHTAFFYDQSDGVYLLFHTVFSLDISDVFIKTHVIILVILK